MAGGKDGSVSVLPFPAASAGIGASLAGLAERHTGEIAHASWFAATLEPLTLADQADAVSVLHGFHHQPLPIRAVDSWSQAKSLLTGSSWSIAWWDGEEAERRRLAALAEARHGSPPMLEALTRITEVASDTVHGAAAIALARTGLADPGLSRAAAGAATESCYRAGLVEAAGLDGSHPFATRHRLFLGGRWPLGVIGDAYWVV